MFANLRNGWLKSLVYRLFGGESRLARRLRRRAASRRAMAPYRRPRLELLECRLAMTAFTVTDATDTAGNASDVTLRYALTNAQNGDQIGFSNSLSGQTITLSSTLTISTNVEITGLGAQNLAINGNNAVRVFTVNSGVMASISGLTITNGSSPTGGGIGNYGTLSLSNDTISGNGTISNTENHEGAGIYNSNSGSMTIGDCTISGNTTYTDGGGIYNQGTMTLINSTIFGNAAYTYGGGIYNSGAITLSDDTISGNFGWANSSSLPNYGGGIYNVGTLQMSDTIVAGNSASVNGQDIYGPVAAGTNNLVGIGSGMTGLTDNLNGNQVGIGSPIDPGLGSLAYKGGPTQTLALQANSPAIGAGVTVDYPGTSTPITTDQRGEIRVSTPDIGAYEYNVPANTLLVSASPSNLSAGSTVSITITAEDALNNVVPGFSDTVTLSDSLGGAGFSAISFSGGMAAVTATLDTAGTQTITATDPTATLSATSSGITVTPAAASQLLVSVPPNGLGTTASATYSVGVANPTAMAFDSSGDLFIANYSTNTVSEVVRGSTTATPFITSGLNGPRALAFDSSGDLFIANGTGNTVSEVVRGSTTATPFITSGLNGPRALAFDSSGDLFIANYNTNVSEVHNGSTTATPFITSGLSGPAGLAFDSNGDLFISNAGSNVVLEVVKGSSTATTFISSGLNSPASMAFDSGGNLFIANPGSNTVSVVANGSSTASTFISSGLSGPTPLTFDSSGNLYVGNQNNSTVKVFLPAAVTAGGTASVIITAEDQFNNVVTGFSDSVTLSDSLDGASFSAVSFTNGLATVSATLDKAGTQTITASDSSATIAGTSNAVTVTAAAASKLLVSASPSSLTAGSTTSVTVTAEDQFNNVVTSFGDSVTLSDSLGGGTFGGVTFSGGQATVTATLNTAGTQTITATDASATIAGGSSAVTVTPAAVTDLLISASPTNEVSFSGGVFSAVGANPNINITDLYNALVSNPNVLITNSGLAGVSDNIEWLAGANLSPVGIPAGHTLTIETAPSATSGNLSIASTVNLPDDLLLSGQSVSLNAAVNAGGTLRINSGGAVSQSAPLSAANLAVVASGNVSLTSANDVAGKVAINDIALGAYVEWLDTVGFEVGSIAAATAAEDPQSLFGAVSGVSTSGNFIALENTSGNMLLGDSAAGEGITATGGDVRLESAGAITQNASGDSPITAGALGIVADGNVELSQVQNMAVLLSINNSSGYARFVDGESFAVGTVGAVSASIFPNAVHGVTTVGGDIGLQNNSGNMQLGNGNASEVVSATGAGGDVRLDSAGRIYQIPGSGAVTAAAFAVVAHGNVDLTESPNTAILVAMSNSSGYVRFVDSEGFNVGTVGGVSAMLDPNVLHGVTTVGGDIGLQNNAGSMVLGDGNASAVVSATGAGGDVRLESAGAITQNSGGGGAITAAALGVVAAGPIQLSTTINTVTMILAIDDTAAGAVHFSDDVSFNQGTVGAISSKIFPNAISGVTTVTPNPTL